jgi:hypothetical protein
MTDPTFIITIRDGKPRSRVLAHLIREAKEGDQMWVTVRQKKPTRSELQNSYYWLYLTLVAESTGNSKNDLHLYFKHNLLGYDVAEIKLSTGAVKTFNKLRSTAKLNRLDFTEYLDRIEKITGIPLPDTSEFLI